VGPPENERRQISNSTFRRRALMCVRYPSPAELCSAHLHGRSFIQHFSAQSAI